MTNPTKIPFLDLVTPHRQLQEELLEVVKKAFSNAGFIGGPMVESFERDFAEFSNTKYCVGVNSGTDALRFAFMAAGIRSGDIIITVPNTFIATTEAISQAGGQIAFVDIHQQTYTMDPEKLREYVDTKCEIDRSSKSLVESKSRRPVVGIVPVHLYGQTADMDPILEIAQKYGLFVIEDACQAHGAEYFSKKENAWKRAGSMGKAAAFSFYPGKNLGACGEAGAITTNDEALAHKMAMIRDHGQAKKYYHDMEGYNGRLDAIQAGWLSVKLRHLAKWNESRRSLAHRYHELLEEAGGAIVVPLEASWTKGVYHLYVIRVQDREALQVCLAEAGIGSGIHYPIPLHLQKAYRHLGYKKGDFAVTERVAAEIVSLPMFPELTHRQQEEVANNVKEFASSRISASQGS
ncbi:MAG: DegT/DnrJ/EryC1/StrS family aminotransferase [Candidatus Acidiferrum sp.]